MGYRKPKLDKEIEQETKTDMKRTSMEQMTPTVTTVTDDPRTGSSHMTR